MQRLKSNNVGRRSFIKTVGGVTGTALLTTSSPLPLLAQFGSRSEDIPAITDPSVNSLVFKGVEAAQSAGAQYSEVRLTNGLLRDISLKQVSDSQRIHASVRVFVNGHWGFAAGPIWEDDAIVELARRATLHAKENAAISKVSKIAIDALPKVDVVRNEHWHMPVKVDPLSVHPFAIQDFFQGLVDKSLNEFRRNAQEKATVSISGKFFVQERAFGTSDDWYTTERKYLTSGSLRVLLAINRGGGGSDGGGRGINLLHPASLGWELFTDQPLKNVIVQALNDIRADTRLPPVPVTPGKFEIILDAATIARLVSETIGSASDIDRALGYEANLSGTSYLNNPAGMLDTFTVGSPLLTVRANRSDPGGAATVKWDDEGVTPIPFTVVKDGVLHDYHCSREGISWLQQEKLAGRNRPQGVVVAQDASKKPYVHTANLEIAPSNEQVDATEMMSQIENGIFIMDGNVNMDSSLLNGIVHGGNAYEIKGGKKVARITGAALVVHTPELWKSLSILGGSDSKDRIGLTSTKGEPVQYGYHSVTSVPAAFKEQTITDFNLR